MIIVSLNANIEAGGGRIMLGLAEFARSFGIKYYTASPYQNKIVLENHINISNKYELYFNRRIGQLFGFDSAFLKFGTNKLLKQLKRIKPDIIHLHAVHGWYVNYAKILKFSIKNNIKIVWTQHDNWTYTGKCTHFSNANCYKWIDGCNTCPLLKQYPRSVIFDNSSWMYKYKKKLFLKYDNIIYVSVSRWLDEIIKKSFIKNKDLIVIENGIDVDIFKKSKTTLREKYGLKNEKIVLGVASHWSERKGFKDFIQLSTHLKEYNVKIILVGLSEAQIETAHTFGILGFPKTRTVHELVDFYSTADVFFNPSVEETFGLVTIEAMSCDLPVIVYNATASPEVVFGTNGFIVKPNNILEVKNIILNQLKIESNGRQKVLSYYNKDKQFEKYIELYKKMGGTINV